MRYSIEEDEKHNSQLFEMCDRTDPHDMMTAHIHYLIESWDDQPQDLRQWLIDLRDKYGAQEKKMRVTEMVPAAPITVQKSMRSARGRVLTSGDAGKILPLKYEWLHREDGVQSGKIRVNVEMMETSEMLMNGVGVTLYAHFVPMLAFDRFNGSMNELNASYKGENGVAGSVVPFFDYNKYYNHTTNTVVSTSGPEDWDTNAALLNHPYYMPSFFSDDGYSCSGF